MSNIYPYIRGTNKKYGTPGNGGFWGENGFNCIEVGYLKVDDTAQEILEIITLIDNADSIMSLNGIMMDCTGDGYIRLFHSGTDMLRWKNEKVPISTMILETGEPLANSET